MQEPAPLRSLQMALEPHGEGLQGSIGPSVVTGTEKKIFLVGYINMDIFISAHSVSVLKKKHSHRLKYLY